MSCCNLQQIICIYICIGSVAIHQAACKCVWHDLQAALLLDVWLCWWICDWNGFWVVWTDLLAADRWCLMEMGWKCCIGERFFWIFWWAATDFGFVQTFFRRFLLNCCYRYRSLVSGFAGCLKLNAIKNPCKTVVLWICWNYLWDRCWRLMGKCVIFGFFAADTATKQPKWLVRKCYSTAL